MFATLVCPQCASSNIQTVEGNRYRCEQCDSVLEMRVVTGDAPEPRPALEAEAGYCSQCRAIVLSNARFCHQCGAEVQTLRVLRACPICGKAIPSVSSFCPYCRAQLDLPQEIGCPACGQSIAPTATLCSHCGVDIEGFLAPLRLQIPIALRPCTSCGQLVPVASSYCLHCRAQIILPEDGAGLREWVDCPVCWRTVVPDKGRCPYCGADVKQAVEAAKPVSSQPEYSDQQEFRSGQAVPKPAWVLFLLPAGFLIILIGVMLVILLMRGG